MKRSQRRKRLSLTRETLKLLSEREARAVLGAAPTRTTTDPPRPSQPPGTCNPGSAAGC